MKKEKIFKMRVVGCEFTHQDDGLTECAVHFRFNFDLFNKEFGNNSDKMLKQFKNLGLNFDEEGYALVKGYSKCALDDVYDRTVGERIAESKAKKNAYRVGLRIGKIIEKETRRKLIDVMRFNAQMMKCEDCEVEHAKYVENKRN